MSGDNRSHLDSLSRFLPGGDKAPSSLNALFPRFGRPALTCSSTTLLNSTLQSPPNSRLNRLFLVFFTHHTQKVWKSKTPVPKKLSTHWTQNSILKLGADQILVNSLSTMKHLAAYLLLALAGNESPSAADVKEVLSSVGIDADSDRLEKLIAELQGKDIQEVSDDSYIEFYF